MGVVIALLVSAAFLAWCIAVWSWVAMLRRTRDGAWLRLMFHPLWWVPSRVRDRLTPDGMVYHRRLLMALFTFIGLIAAAIAAGTAANLF